MKILGKILFGILILVTLLVLGRNILIKSAAQLGVKKVTGLPLHIGVFKMGLINTNIDIQEFHLQNPKSFQEDTMLHVPKVYVDYSLLPLLTGKVHLKSVAFHLEEFTVIRLADGTTNLDSLKQVKQEKKETAEKTPAEKKKSGEKPNIQIDHIHLKIGRVRFIQYHDKGEASEKTFNINLDEEYTDITDTNKLVKLILFKTLTKTPIGLAGVGLSGLESALGGTLGVATDIVESTTDKATKVLDEASGTLTETKDKLKGLIKSPFGKK